jgi:Domain of unknown function (DUF1707)
MFAVVSEYTRASDSDRDDTCQVLDAALSDGQLSAEEHRERVSAATKAITLGQLQSLVSDLQISKTPAPLPKTVSPAGNRGTWIAAAVVLVVLVVGGGLVWGLHQDSPSSSRPSASKAGPTPSTASAGGPSVIPTNTTSPLPPAQLLTLSGVTGVLAQVRTQFGDSLGYQLNIYQDKAVLLRPDTANPHTVIEWIYRNGSWTNRGASTAVFSDSAVGDVSKFDVQAVVGVLHEAPQTLQLYGAVTSFLSIESVKDGSLYLNIHVSDQDSRRSGAIAVAADGSVRDIERPPR